MVTLVLVLIMSVYMIRREHKAIKQLKKKIERYD
jgi:predicted PurR-regulated permease PerM